MGYLGCKIDRVPEEEYKQRIDCVKKEMKERELDVLLAYSTGYESGNVRYLADFWPSWESAGVLVPIDGDPKLLTGPECVLQAKAWSRIKDIRIVSSFREIGDVAYPSAEYESWDELLSDLQTSKRIRMGIAGFEYFPVPFYRELQKVVKGEIIAADEILYKLRAIKSENELKIMRRCYEIGCEGLDAAISSAEEGKTECEIFAKAHCKILELGAEPTAYKCDTGWCLSGPNTIQPIARSTDRRVCRGELIQVSLGTRYSGYTSSCCRPFVIGKIPPKTRKLMEAGLGALEIVLENVGPGVKGMELYEFYKNYLNKKIGYTPLYGPIHGTGVEEVEPPSNFGPDSKVVIQPNMVFCVDIWVSYRDMGVRYEDAFIVTKKGIEQMPHYAREIISL